MVITQFPKSYDPAATEAEIRDRWDASGAFHVDPVAGGEPYCIVIPPPNVTSALHLGHALNNTIQDMLIRYHRMRGFNTLWMPGTDHAGIATQTVVEKRLEREGRRRTDMSREAFVERVQAWKDEYEATIIEQLKAMGCSCDWQRVRFTMDPVCVRAVYEAFFRLFCDGLIYRGKRLVNWDPVTLTALADDEVQTQEVDGHMWYLRYPLVPEGESDGAEHVTVATTRPETMLGDTAVAVNPADPRARRLAGRHVRLPLVDRVVPIVADDYVIRPDDPDNPMAAWATGFLKVTPAHDPNDWEIGERHGLTVINVLAPDATISADHGWREREPTLSDDAEALLGLPREEARRRVVEWFESRGLLEAVRDYRHAVGHSYRSHAPIEPYLSDQWYVRVTAGAMRGEALRAMEASQHEGAPPPRDAGARRGDGTLRFHPPRYARTFQTWHENLRDWCISRQLWWGHRIPVWGPPEGEAGDLDPQLLEQYRGEGRVAARPRDPEDPSAGAWVCLRDPDDREIAAALEQAGYVRDPDVLDTWFSSGLWPLSTMGWPEPEASPETAGLLETFNPSSVLCTARDIITLWVSRMVMFNRYFRDGLPPFRHVYIHTMIQDGHGQRMSKSLGNGVDPRDIIHSHGADAMRFVLAQMATGTQDVRLPVEMVCPECGADFDPRQTTSPAGYRVAAPKQTCPACDAQMASPYGAAAGLDEGAPPARNSARKFDQGRNFANKLWNATRFALRSLEREAAEPGETALMDRWILARLRRALGVIEAAVADYEFNVYADTMYELVWADFCDWYVEAIKPTVRGNRRQQEVLRTVLEAVLRMLHPICPFVTEALFPHVQAAAVSPGPDLVRLDDGPPADLLATAAWPRMEGAADEAEVVETVARLQALTGALRNLRSEHGVSPKAKVRLLVTPGAAGLVRSGGGVVETLAGVETVEPLSGEAPAGAVPLAFEGEELFVCGLSGTVDLETERRRLGRRRDELQRAIAGYRRRLDNRDYVTKAPAHVVEQTRSRLAEAEADLAAAERALDLLEAD